MDCGVGGYDTMHVSQRRHPRRVLEELHGRKAQATSMLYRDATELAIVQRDRDGRVRVGKICSVERLEVLERVKPKWRVAILCSSFRGTVAVDMSRCFKAVCTALFSCIWEEVCNGTLGSTARARSKSVAVALATMPWSFLNVFSHFQLPNAPFSALKQPKGSGEHIANFGLSHLHIAFAR